MGPLNPFGPVLFYDLVRTARRTRYIFFRTLYAAGLFLVLLWVYFTWSLVRAYDPGNPIEQMARMAESYFATFLTVQLLVVLVLTPAYTAGAVAEEKDRKTLEFILATDLRDREIILSKLTSRLANLGLLLLAGLPILSLMQFLGGVDPLMVAAGFTATLLTMLSVAALSMLLSVYARKTRDAVAQTYLLMIAYLALTPLLLLVLRHAIPQVGGLAIWFGAEPPTVLDAMQLFSSGNVFIAYYNLATAVGTGGRLSEELPELLGEYAGFHVTLAAVCTVWAVARLRAVALRQASTPGRTKAGPRAPRRPPVDDRPMRWKELHAESAMRSGRAGRILLGAAVAVSFLPAAWIVVDYLFVDPSRGVWSSHDRLGERINIWLRIAGMIVACLLLLAVAVRAAGSVSGERDRQTLDSLLTTPLDTDTILFAKWQGSLLSVRRAWWWLGGMWLVGLILGGLHPVAVPLLAAAWLSVAALLAWVGVWFSTTSATTARATVLTMLTALSIGGGHWLVTGLCCYMPISLARMVTSSEMEWVPQFEAFGLTPPVTFAWLAFRGDEYEFTHRSEGIKFTVFAVFGMLIWVMLTFVIQAHARDRFAELTLRSPFRRRPKPPP